MWVQQFYKRWVGVRRMQDPRVLYQPYEGPGRGLQLTHLGDVLQLTRLLKCHVLKYSRDVRCRNMYEHRRQQIGVGRRRAETDGAVMLERLEQAWQMELEMGGVRYKNGEGLGRGEKRPETLAEKRKFLADRKKAELADQHAREAQELTSQAARYGWSWQHMEAEKLNHQRICNGMSDDVMRFVIQAQANTLPTGSNLKRWKVQGAKSDCALCGMQNQTDGHIFGWCPYVMHQEERLYGGANRIKWRHDNVCLELTLRLMEEATRVNLLPADERGEGTLYEARDWEVLSDLPDTNGDAAFIFPPEIAVLAAKPDMILISRREMIVLLIELTCPLEENMQKREVQKNKKYSVLKDVNPEWKVMVETVEFSARVGAANHTVRETYT
eukprot:SAG11_NODE_4094_length_2068_cov_18.058405_2_plen_383_part_01